jgi:FAD dependent oxidoreductase
MISRRVFLFGASALCISLSERSVAWAGRTPPHPTLPDFAFEPEAVAIIDAMTAAGAAPSANRQYFINRTVKRIKNIGAWPSEGALPRSRLAIFSTETAGTADLIDWFNPAVRTLSIAGTPTFITQRGYSFTLAGDCFRTGVGLQQLSQNDIHCQIFCDSYHVFSTNPDIGATDSAGNGITVHTHSSTASTALIRACSALIVAPNAARYTGGNHSTYFDRSSPATIDIGKCGNDISKAHPSTSMPFLDNTEITIGAPNFNGTIHAGSGRVIRGFLLCPSLTDAQKLECYAAITAYMNGVKYGEPELHDPGYQPTVVTADAIFLGCTSMSIFGAVKHKRDGHNPIIVGAERERTADALGGQPANGLCYTDSYDFASIGGLPRAVYTYINELMGRADRNAQAAFGVPNKFWNFAMRRLLDPSRTGALAGFAIPVYFADRVQSVAYSAATGLYTVVTGDGRTFIAPNFHDNSYSQESFDAIGVPYTSGSEQSGAGLEANNGYRGPARFSLPKRATGTRYRIDPYVTPGVPASGYLPNVVDPPALGIGAADPTTQAMVFRLSLTQQATVGVPWDTTPPPNYDPMTYEALGRLFALDPTFPFSDVFNIKSISWRGASNVVFDFNNSETMCFSLDVIGSGTAWVAAQCGSFAQREAVYKDVENRIRGLIYWLLYSGDARIPAAIKTAMGSYFLICDHNLDPHPNDRVFWDSVIYVRQCRRLKNTGFVMNGNDYAGATGSTPRSNKTIACASYALDDHLHRVVAYDDGGGKVLWQQGGFWDTTPVTAKTMTPVPIETIITDANFTAGAGFSTATGLSCTQVANGALRVEPTMMEIGQAQGAMSSERVEKGTDYRQINYTTLRARMLDGVDAVPLVLPQLN